MKRLVLIRDSFIDDRATLGTFFVYEGAEVIFKSECLELAFLNNEKMRSSIPVGKYKTVLEYSPRFDQQLWELKDVPGRGEIKIHAANFFYDLNGCIALGRRRAHIDQDDVPDVTDSREMMRLFHWAMGEQTVTDLLILNLQNIAGIFDTAPKL